MTISVPKKKVGTSDMEVSLLSLGSWHTYDRMDFADAVAMLKRAIDVGITLYDVGVYSHPDYPPTFTDVIFSAMVRAAGLAREDYQISAKLWLEGFDADTGFKPQLENAFFRAGIEHTDMAILGDLRTDGVTLEGIIQSMGELTSEGLVGEWGVNNWSATNITRLQELAAEHGVKPPQIAQLKYSIARRSIPDGEPFSKIFDTGFSMQSSDIFEGGILAGRTNITRQIGRDPGNIRDAIIDVADGVNKVADDLGITPAQLSLAFTLTHRANVNTLFGATRMEQLEQNLEALGVVERVGAEELRSLLDPFWADRGIVDPEGP